MEAGPAGTSPSPDASPQPGACRLAAPAFCETFETSAPGGRGGDIDERTWSFARYAHLVEYHWVRQPAHTYPADFLFPATFCGKSFADILPEQDVRICSGVGVDATVSQQLDEVLDDQGAFAINSMRIRQPFDFANRTGTIAWDVDGKVNPLNSGHGWWITLWITEEPIPIPFVDGDTVHSVPSKSVSFDFRNGADCPEDSTNWQNGIDGVGVTDNYQIIHSYPSFQLDQSAARCFKVADAHLNHFELRISSTTAELWVSDFDDPASFQLRTTVHDLGLTFTRGYVHLQHGQFNAALDGNVTPSQTFRWDNIGFDGPVLPTPRAYDVLDNGAPNLNGGGVLLGWDLRGGQTQSFPFHGVDLTGVDRASFNVDIQCAPGDTFEYRVNGQAPHTFEIPTSNGIGGGVHGFSLPVPLAELARGDNTVEVRFPTPMQDRSIANVDLTLDTAP
jgi:hypothetical protein